MFYAHFVLSKKGPLARIWLAAHWDKKVTKAHVYETDIVSSVAAILEPKLKMALRTSGHLLLGVVRIYSRKAKYLLADCNEAYIKIKMAFRPGLVDLPEENREAALAAITLPDTLNVDFDMHLLDADFDLAPAASGFFELDLPGYSASFTDSQQARVDDITIHDSSAIPRPLRRTHDDDDFGDAGFFASDIVAQRATDIEMARADQPRSAALSGDVSAFGRESTSIALDDRSRDASTKRKDTGDVHLLLDAADADFGDAAAMLGIAPSSSRPAALGGNSSQSRMAVAVDEFGDEQFGGFIADELGASNTADILFGETNATAVDHTRDALGLVEENEAVDQNALNDETESAAQNLNAIIAGAAMPRSTQVNVLNATRAQHEDTTLVANASDAFVLEPQVGNTTMQIVTHRTGGPRSIASSAAGTTHTRATGLTAASTKRKRRLIIDDQKSIPSDAMKAQMQVTTDIVTTLELAPPTKRLMFWKELGTADRLVAQPAAPSRAIVFSRPLERAFARRLVISRWSNWNDASDSHKRVNEDVESLAEVAEKRAREDNIDMIELTDASDVQIENVPHDSALNGATFDGHDDLFAIVDNPDMSAPFDSRADATATATGAQSFTKNISPIRPAVDDHVGVSRHTPASPVPAPAPVVYDETMERLAMNAVASEGLEAGEQAFLGKKVLAFYGELQQLAAASGSAPRSTRRNDGASKQTDGAISFAHATRRATRKQAANKFLALLFLLKQNCVAVEQRGSYSDISVRLLSTGTVGRSSQSQSQSQNDGSRRNEQIAPGSPQSPDSRPAAASKHHVGNTHSRSSSSSNTNHSRASYATCASPTNSANALSINLQRNASSLTIQ